MEVINFESEAYKNLMTKINMIAQYVAERFQDSPQSSDEIWVDSYEVCTFLKISQRTLQRLRSKGYISYSLIQGRSYYTIAEIKRMLREKRIRSNEEALQQLIDNHRHYVEQRRITKPDK